MPRTMTLLNHGTNSHRTRDDGELIAIFGDLMWKEWNGRRGANEYRDYLISDGPGSTTNGDRHNPMPGQFDPNYIPKQPRGGLAAVHNPTTWSGMGSGAGWEDNVVHLMTCLEELERKGELPDRINMIGWSRGGVTCTKMANAIHRRYTGKIHMNIFAIDPVAGLGNKDDDTNDRIPPTVDNYLATLAMDERRHGFEPQDLDRVKFDQRTNRAFLPFPGKHNTQLRHYLAASDAAATGGHLGKADYLTAAAKVVWSLAYRFLAGHGTKFCKKLLPIKLNGGWRNINFRDDVMKTYTDDGYLELYDQMRFFRDLYARFLQNEGAGQWVQGGYKQRRFTYPHNICKYVQHPYFFINAHHRMLFLRRHPEFAALFPTLPDPVGFRAPGSEVPCGPCQIAPDWSKLFPQPDPADELGWVDGDSRFISSYQGRSAEKRDPAYRVPTQHRAAPPPPQPRPAASAPPSGGLLARGGGGARSPLLAQRGPG